MTGSDILTWRCRKVNDGDRFEVVLKELLVSYHTAYPTTSAIIDALSA